jgi:hypothetical protein
MQSLIYLLHIFLFIYLGSFIYITYQILFYFQNKFIFIKLILYFSFIAYLIIKVKYKYNILLIYQYIIFFVLGIYLGRKTFRTSLLSTNQKIKNALDSYWGKLIYLLKILFIPPISFYLFCKLKNYFYYLKNPHLKPKDIYDLF